MSRPAPKAPAGGAGFTLIELVVVLTIIGVLAIVAVPRLIGVEHFRAVGYADELAAALRYAQKAAVASGCRVQAVVDGSGYSLHGAGGCNDDNFTIPVAHPSRPGGFVGSTPSGVTVSGSLTTIFNPLGDATAGGSVTVSGSRTIAVVAQTGYVEKTP